MSAFGAVSRFFTAAFVVVVLCSIEDTYAMPCTVTLANTNPDASLTNATACDIAAPIGSGHSPAATQVGLNADNPGGLGVTWSFIDRDPGTEAGDIEAAFGMTGTGSGTWLINKDAVGSFNRFIATLKDGSPLQDDFLWFLIDTAAGMNACSASQAAAGWDLCGTWQMYGTNGNSKNVSHMDLFGATVESTVTPSAIPEPTTAMLLAVGFYGVWRSRSKSRQAK